MTPPKAPVSTELPRDHFLATLRAILPALGAMPPRLVFLCEPSQLDPGEFDAAQAAGWFCTSTVLALQRGDLVIARHYAWPWESRLNADCTMLGATLLNDAHAYRYAANPLRWSEDLAGLTPETWDDFTRLPDDGTAFILKGEKADKGRWSRMYAPTKAAAIALRSELQTDSGMRGQTIVARRYVPLERLGDGLGGCPVSTEFRVFVLDGEVVGRGFYWPPDDCTTPPPSPAVIPDTFLREAIERVRARLRFFTLDVARTAAGAWLVIEVSDGQRAGLSEVQASELYPAMDRVLRRGSTP